MKVSVSLPNEDLQFVDSYMARSNSSSRSAVIHEAIALLRTVSLEEAYVAAWQEWDESENAQLWKSTTSDGLTNAAW